MKSILIVLLALSLAMLVTGSAWAASRKAPDKKSELKDKSAAPAATQEAKPQTPPAKQAGKPAGREGKSSVRQDKGAKPSAQFGRQAVKPEARKDARPETRAFAEAKGGSRRGAEVGRKDRKVVDKKDVRRGARPESKRDVRGADARRPREMQRARPDGRGREAGFRNEMRRGGRQAQGRAIDARRGRQPYGHQWISERPRAERQRDRMMTRRGMDVRGMGQGMRRRMHAAPPGGRRRAMQPRWADRFGGRGPDRRDAMMRPFGKGGRAMDNRDKRAAGDDRARPQVRGEKGRKRPDKDQPRPKADWREKERDRKSVV